MNHCEPHVFTRPELRHLPPEQADGQACVVCGEAFTGKKIAVAENYLPRYTIYAPPKCKPQFKMVTWADVGSC